MEGEKILTAARKKEHITFRGPSIQKTTDFPSKTIGTRESGTT